MPHELKLRAREMTARRRSKMAVLTPSILNADTVPGGGGGRERERVESLYLDFSAILLPRVRAMGVVERRRHRVRSEEGKREKGV